MRTSIGILAAGVLALTTGAAMAAEKTLDRSFTVKPGGVLTVDADGADISVAGTNSNQVVVHISVSASQKALDALTLSASETDGGVAVEMVKRQGGLFHWDSWSMESQIKVTVPRNYRLELKTSGGNMEVDHLDGDVKGKTSGGDVRLQDIAGQVAMRTSGGDMTVEDIKGDVQLTTSGGDIVAKNVRGGFEAQTSGGGVKLEAIDGPTRARSSSGDIVANTIHGAIDADTSGGDVRLLRVDGKIHAHTSGGNVHCELVGANRGISATTSGGNVKLLMAKGTAGTLDAASSGGKITTEFPVTTTATGGTRLNGPINGGGEAIYARTSGGNIVLSVN